MENDHYIQREGQCSNFNLTFVTTFREKDSVLILT